MFCAVFILLRKLNNQLDGWWNSLSPRQTKVHSVAGFPNKRTTSAGLQLLPFPSFWLVRRRRVGPITDSHSTVLSKEPNQTIQDCSRVPLCKRHGRQISETVTHDHNLARDPPSLRWRIVNLWPSSVAKRCLSEIITFLNLQVYSRGLPEGTQVANPSSWMTDIRR